MRASKRIQNGAAMVEFSIACTLFLVIVFSIIQISLSYYAWNNVSEAARGGARYMIVNTPLQSITCPGTATATVKNGSGPVWTGLIAVIQSKAAYVKSSQVSVTYACSGAGNPAAPSPISDVTVTISGVPNPFVFWITKAEGFSATQTLPAASVTRTGESLATLTPTP